MQDFQSRLGRLIEKRPNCAILDLEPRLLGSSRTRMPLDEMAYCVPALRMYNKRTSLRVSMRATKAVPLVLVAALPILPALRAQAPMGTGASINLYNSDLAVMEAGDPRKDLGCTVTPVKPQIGFDLRFHSGYEVTVPLRELVG